jgi:hypothetical protein
MDSSGDSHLSRIETFWTILATARGDSPEAAAVSATGYRKPASLAAADTSISTPPRIASLRVWRWIRSAFSNLLPPQAGE